MGTFLIANLKFFSISLPSINKAEFIFNLASKFFKNDVFGLLILKSETTVSFPSLNLFDKAPSENQNNEIKSSDNSVSDSKNVDSTDKESVAENKENKTSENKKE